MSISQKQDIIQKNQKFRTCQQDILKSIARKCTKSTFAGIINSDGVEIKHFILKNGTHVYATDNSEHSKQSRVISSVELPNVSYFRHHYNPMIVPDSDFSKVNGAFIYITGNSVSYAIHTNGIARISAGYNYNLANPNKISFFCWFTDEKHGKFFNTIPDNVENILQLLEKYYSKNKYSQINGISDIYLKSKKIFQQYENCSVSELPDQKSDDKTTSVVGIAGDKKCVKKTAETERISGRIDSPYCQYDLEYC